MRSVTAGVLQSARRIIRGKPEISDNGSYVQFRYVSLCRNGWRMSVGHEPLGCISIYLYDMYDYDEVFRGCRDIEKGVGGFGVLPNYREVLT